MTAPLRTKLPSFTLIAIAIASLLAVCYVITAIELVQHACESKEYGYWLTLDQRTMVVTSVVKGGVVDGLLQVGDRITAVNGHGRMASWLINRHILFAPGGSEYTVTLLRGNTRMDARLPVRAIKSPLYWGIPVHFAASLACFAVALLMGLVKPGDRTVQWICLTFFALAAVHLFRPLAVMNLALDDVGRDAMALLMAFDPLQAATGYLFAARFPKPVKDSRTWKLAAVLIVAVVWAEWLRRLPWVIFAAMDLNQGEAYFLRWYRLLLFLNAMPHQIWKAVTVAIIVAMWAVMSRNYRALTEADQRRRIRWVVLGMALALLPQTALYAGAVLHHFTGFGFPMETEWFPLAEDISAANVGIVLPVCIAYAVLRHRILDIHLAVRTSIRYLMTKRTLQAAIFLPIVLIVWRIVSNPRLTVRELLFGSYFYLGLMLAAAAALIYRRQLLALVDRRFFQEAYNQEMILRRLIEDVKSLDAISDISRIVADRLDASLHPVRVLVFYRQDRRSDFTLEHSSGGDGLMRLAADCPALRVLEEKSGPVDYPFNPRGDSASDEDAYFERLGIRLMAPIRSSNANLIGILLLGERRSEQPYTSTDRNLIQAIAAQIGVVCENVALREAAKREMQIKRHVLARVDGSDMNLLKECPQCGCCYDRADELCAADGTALSLTLPVERTIDGVYRLERRIGSGGMGAVFRAMDLRLGRSVAVKVMMGSLFGNAGAIRRFEREARAAARLSHPNIVAVYDFGPIGTDGAYLVMELVEGRTFRAELRAGALGAQTAARRFAHLLDGLIAAHGAGIVHRDLKPENLITADLAGGTELLKILDFGLAKLMDAQGASGQGGLSAVGAVLGTLGYMSPEQLLGEEVDERSDIYSVGVILVETLTGRRPFSGSSFQELVRDCMTRRYEFPVNTPEYRRLNAVVQRCLAPRREVRPAAIELKPELISALTAVSDAPPAVTALAGASTIDGTRIG